MTAGYIRNVSVGQFTLPVTFHIDASRLNLALSIAEKVSTRAPQKVMDSTAYHIVKRTIELTPHVPISRMDAELGTAVTLKAKKGGFYRAKKTRTYASGRMVALKRSGAGYNAVPLAAAIIQSSVLSAATSAGSFSRYNQRTNFRFSRMASPFKGKSRAAGRAAMRAAVHRLIAARHSSSKFLILGWVEVKRLLLGKIYDGEPATDASPGVLTGEIHRQGQGATYALTISNLIGMAAGSRGDNSASYNQALHRHGGPAFQRAIDEQAEDMIRHYWDRYVAKELKPAWEAAVK